MLPHQSREHPYTRPHNSPDLVYTLQLRTQSTVHRKDLFANDSSDRPSTRPIEPVNPIDILADSWCPRRRQKFSAGYLILYASNRQIVSQRLLPAIYVVAKEKFQVHGKKTTPL